MHVLFHAYCNFHFANDEWFLAWGGTFSVKFGIYMRQMTIFKGVIRSFSNLFLSPYFYLIF